MIDAQDTIDRIQDALDTYYKEKEKRELDSTFPEFWKDDVFNAFLQERQAKINIELDKQQKQVIETLSADFRKLVDKYDRKCGEHSILSGKYEALMATCDRWREYALGVQKDAQKAQENLDKIKKALLYGGNINDLLS
jgi:predicted metal-dependent hydrolase